MDIIKKLENGNITYEELMLTSSIALNSCNLQELPDCIYFLEQLKEISCNNNNICDIGDFITNLPCLGIIYLIQNEFEIIPEALTQVKKAFLLDMTRNKIASIPNSITNLKSLKYLYLRDNKLKEIPEYINELVNLRQLDISKNILDQFPESVIKLNNLCTLLISENQIEIIPNTIIALKNLEKLDLYQNEIKEIPSSIYQLSELSYLSLEYNQITLLPSSLGRMQKCNLRLSHNPIEYIPPNVARLLERQKVSNSIYSDLENIHNHHIQECIRYSIDNILNDNIPYHNQNYLSQLLENNHMEEKTKQLIFEYMDDKSIHVILNITFKDLFGYIWNRIVNHQNHNEMLKILSDEMKKAECKCFIGKLTRLVSVLDGYYDDVVIEISENEQISNVILMIRSKYINQNIDDEEIKKIIEKELSERTFDRNLIKEWIDHL